MEEEAEGRCGKWLLFCTKGEELDGWWVKVRDATVSGKLGYAAKVSTMKENPNAHSSKTGVICVYTTDIHSAETDRVRQKLRDMGVTKKIPYKLDQDIGNYTPGNSKRYE